MAVETPEDRLALFRDWGEAAEYVPPAGGAATSCTIVYNRDRGGAQPYEAAGGEDMALQSEIAWAGAQILADEVETVERGGTLTIGVLAAGIFLASETLTVVGRPSRDETGEIWTVDLEPAA